MSLFTARCEGDSQDRQVARGRDQRDRKGTTDDMIC